MGLPPQLTAQQRQEALLKATASRKRRAEVKIKIKNGEFSMDTVLEIAKNWKNTSSSFDGKAQYFTYPKNSRVGKTSN
jgi:ribosomal protein L11